MVHLVSGKMLIGTTNRLRVSCVYRYSLITHPPTCTHTHTIMHAHMHAIHYGFENRISEYSKKGSVNSTRDNFDNFIHEACCVSAGGIDWA